MRRWALGCGIAVVFALVLSFGVVSLLLLATRPTNRVIFQNCVGASTGATMPPGTDLCLSVLEGETSWAFFPLSGVRRIQRIFIGVGEDPTYGHSVDYGFHYELEDDDVYIQRITVDWTEEGVIINEPSGHRLFIPAAAYAGGR